MTQFPIGTFVDTFLDGEKEGARRLIRHEMESMIDPLVESLFKQLKHKLGDYLETSWNSQQEHQLAHDREGNGQMIRDHDTIFKAQQYHSQSLDNSHSIDANCQLNSMAHSITDPLNVQFEPQLNDHSINSSSSAQESTLIPSTSTEQTLSNTEIQQQQLIPIKHNQFDDEDECDCDKCVYGGIEVKEEDDDNDNVKWAEEGQEDGESSPPVKRTKMDTTHNEINAQTEVTMVNTRQSPRQPTDQTQSNQVIQLDKQIITVHLRCPECPDTFPETELNDHLMDEHLIGPNRCLVKDCKQSFDNAFTLDQHLKQSHQHTTQWHCDKCPKYFTTYKQLFHHNNMYHQLGHFQCSFPSCTFTGECTVKVYIHYTQQHKQTLNCQHPGCSFRTQNRAHMKRHQRTHSGIKPYRCKWPLCDYAGTRKNHTIDHIRDKHLARNARSVPNGAQLDPKDYLEIVDELL